MQAITEDYIPYADGEIAVLALKKAGFKNVTKIPGVELWIDFLEARKNLKVAAVGSTPEVIQLFAQKFAQSFPQHTLVYFQDGFSIREKLEELGEKIALHQPDVVLLALGQPRQEILARDLYLKHRGIYFCLGGSFDVFTGKVDRAPQIFISLKLEWLFRLLMQPWRLKRIWRLPFLAIQIKLGFEEIRRV